MCIRDRLRDVTWLVGPGERTGILGVNGAGKSTLLGLVTGAVRPSRGRVKRGTTVKVATLTQELAELDDLATDRVSDVVARYRTTYASGGKEMTPGQLLERLGFTNAQLSTPVGDLSGGQRRRLQLLLVLLDEPNVLVLDEPTNDMDTDMLAALEDLLDSWPGTLLVVSHDRYLLERVTDHQVALFGDGRIRDLPGGVEEYLRLRAAAREADDGGAGAVAGDGDSGSGRAAVTDAAQERAARKDMQRLERQLERLSAQTAKLEAELAKLSAEAGDFERLAAAAAEFADLNAQYDELETRWLELLEDLD